MQKAEDLGTWYLGPENRGGLFSQDLIKGGKSSRKGYYSLVIILKGLEDLQGRNWAVGSAQRG
jgi:hypothetical protein